MKHFSNNDIADYYNQTLNHYQRWWKLDETLAVHYGFWEARTSSFKEALENTNRYLADHAEIKPGSRILDAGCGVGGSAIYLVSHCKAKVSGITLSEKQFNFAVQKSKTSGVDDLVDFKLEDYTQTSFKDGTFDLIWAIESLTSAPDKAKFAQEAARILNKGGRIVIADYFKISGQADPRDYLEKWRNSWSMAPFLHIGEYLDLFQQNGFEVVKNEDVTELIRKTSKRMYRSSLLGALPSMVYNAFHRTSRFAKDHYKSGFYQYKALKQNLWEYRVLLLEKSDNN